MVMSNPPGDAYTARENRAYLMIGRHLNQKGLPLPEIHRVDLERGWFILQDMGEKSLQDLVTASDDPVPWYETVLVALFRCQVEGIRGFDPAWCCQTRQYDRHVMVQYEAQYFRDAFLRDYLGFRETGPALEPSFQYLADKAAQDEPGFFLHRDFQSRNIMFSDGKPGIIDWQGGRAGPLGYDLGSLLIDPYTALDAKVTETLYRTYSAMLKTRLPHRVDAFKRSYPYLIVQRNLQILGAFGFLTLKMKKHHFEAYIPRAVQTLSDLLDRLPDPQLSALRRVVQDCLG